MIQAVIFDLDGLLVETETICYQILKEILARFGRPFALEEYTRSFSGKPETVNAAHLVEAYKLPFPAEEALERIRQNRVVREIFDQEDRLRQTRELYFKAFERLRDVENVAVVDGSGSREQVAERIWAAAAPYVLKEGK